MKKFILLLALFFSICGLMYAAQTDTFQISVSITGTGKSVMITETSTTTFTGTNQTVAYSSITVKNDSGGLTEDYQIMGSTTSNNWSLSSDDTAGPNEAVLQALVKAGDTTTGTFEAEDVVTYAYQDCSSTKFSDGDTSNGSGVVNNAIRSLLLQLKTPTSVSNTTETITVTINVK